MYRVKSFVNDTVSVMSNIASVTIPAKGILSSANWTIKASSEELNGEYSPAIYAIDNNVSTYWHSEYDEAQPAYPHYLIIDFGEASTVAGFKYLPRQDGLNSGIILRYEFYVSNDTLNWGEPLSQVFLLREPTGKSSF